MEKKRLETIFHDPVWYCNEYFQNQRLLLCFLLLTWRIRTQSFLSIITQAVVACWAWQMSIKTESESEMCWSKFYSPSHSTQCWIFTFLGQISKYFNHKPHLASIRHVLHISTKPRCFVEQQHTSEFFSIRESVCQALDSQELRHGREAKLPGHGEGMQLFVAHQSVKSAMFTSSHTHHLDLKHIHTLLLVCVWFTSSTLEVLWAAAAWDCQAPWWEQAPTMVLSKWGTKAHTKNTLSLADLWVEVSLPYTFRSVVLFVDLWLNALIPWQL